MVGKLYSVTLTGIEGIIIQVEADVSDGLPCFEIVGIPGSEIKESKERVRASFRNNNYYIPPKRITVNLSPADIRKKGCGFDLPISLSILSALEWFPKNSWEHISKESIFCGELGLDGSLRAVTGILSAVICAKENGFRRCFVPKDNVKEAACIEDMDIIGISSLSEIIKLLQDPSLIDSKKAREYVYQKENSNQELDFSQVNGHLMPRRAIEIAAAGMHNILMVGPPGTGKSMLSKRIASIMPPLEYEESVELTRIYSVCGLLEPGSGLMKERPFRSPHHTCSLSAMTGGGVVPVPGEISLANRGILFLDELPEFKRNVLETLRQPMEDHVVTISRIHGKYQFPANFMVVAAMNPCKCGYYPDLKKCNCTDYEIRQYQNRISGPLLDRIDICVDVQAPGTEELLSSKENDLKNESSDEIRKRVMKAQQRQKERFKDQGIFFNSQMNSAQTEEFCIMEEDAKNLLREYLDSKEINPRGYYKILKLSKTIADLDGSDIISRDHICESYMYRSRS